MKQAVFPCVCLLVCALLMSVIPTEADAAIYEDTVRLHILAKSDSAEDQALKIEIRDKLLLKYSEELKGTKSAEAARDALLGKLPEIERDVEEWVREGGFSYGARAELSREWYETRCYANFTMPAGEYTSLKITLGEGDGQNWWCVMYPPMCLDCALGEKETLSEEELSLISGSGYNVKFKLLELSASLFHNFREK